MRLIDRFVYGLWHPGDRWGLLGSCLFLFFSIKHLKMLNLWKHFSYKVISTDVPYNRNIYIQTSNLVYSVKSCSTLICICFLSKFKYLDTSFAIPVLWLHLQNYVKFCQNGWFFLKIVVYTYCSKHQKSFRNYLISRLLTCRVINVCWMIFRESCTGLISDLLG